MGFSPNYVLYAFSRGAKVLDILDTGKEIFKLNNVSQLTNKAKHCEKAIFVL